MGVISALGVVTECSQWVVDSLDYLIMKYRTTLVSVLLGSVIPTFCSVFVTGIYLLYLYCIANSQIESFSHYGRSNRLDLFHRR